MALFNTPPKKVELPYIFTALEKVALKLLPEELVKSTNHNEKLLEMLIQEEARDAEWKHTRSDAFDALRNNDTEKLLNAVKNITHQQRQQLVSEYYFSLSKNAKETGLTKIEARHHTILSLNINTDLFYLTIHK